MRSVPRFFVPIAVLRNILHAVLIINRLNCKLKEEAERQSSPLRIFLKPLTEKFPKKPTTT